MLNGIAFWGLAAIALAGLSAIFWDWLTSDGAILVIALLLCVASIADKFM